MRVDLCQQPQRTWVATVKEGAGTVTVPAAPLATVVAAPSPAGKPAPCPRPTLVPATDPRPTLDVPPPLVPAAPALAFAA